ncbi:universal stress protein [Rhizobiaceae bacterium]|nr:universal stress protein [Rhizobiaceae bacterium]
MTLKLIVGLDGQSSGERAVSHAKRLAGMVSEAELILVYVIEWSPYTFQTPEENEERHKRREEEIDKANSRVVAPALEALAKAGVKARGMVKHGNVADLLNSTAVEEGADQIVVARSSEGGFAARMFGTSTANLVMTSSVPVTVVA